MRPRLRYRWLRASFRLRLRVSASPQMEHGYFEAYCFTCHSGPNAKAGLELDKLDTAHVEKDAEKWERVVRMLRCRHDAEIRHASAGSEDLRSRDGVDGE